MSEDIKQRIANRRKCAYTMKRFNMRIFVISIVILSTLCGVMLARIYTLEQTVQATAQNIEEMKTLLTEQQGILEELTNGLNCSGQRLPGDEVSAEDEDIQQDLESAEEMTQAAHTVHLTFDDGPSIYTREILDILDDYHVKATFFVVGKDNDLARELLCEIVDRGHSLGMHSYSHDYSTIYKSADAFAEDFAALQSYLYEVTGVKSMLYRFPGGSSNTVSAIDMHQFADYLEEQGVTFYDWNISAGDGGSGQLTVEELVTNCTKDITQWKSSIILLHDSADKRTTVDALPTIIENILAVEDTVILPITEETRPVQHINQ